MSTKQLKEYIKHDSLWKDAIEEFFEDFLKFFAPDILKTVDMSKGYEFLEQELNQLYYGSETQDRRIDKLIKLYQKDSTEKWILCHVEIQGYKDNKFNKRMFQYFYRILDRHDKNTFVLAILSDEDKHYTPNKYNYKFFDTELNFNYRTYKILEQDEEILKASDNPFAFVILTALYSLKTKGNIDLKYTYKVSLYRFLKSKDWSKENINKLFIFMDSVLSLPKSLKDRFKFEIKNIEKEGELAMGLSLEKSETGKLFAKDRDIEIAKKMFIAKKDIKEILEFTELTEEEFQREVVDKLQKKNN